jgi:hypothetical protein
VEIQAPIYPRQPVHRWRWGFQPYAPTALYFVKDSWYALMLEAGLIQGHIETVRIKEPHCSKFQHFTIALKKGDSRVHREVRMNFSWKLQEIDNEDLILWRSTSEQRTFWWPDNERRIRHGTCHLKHTLESKCKAILVRCSGDSSLWDVEDPTFSTHLAHGSRWLGLPRESSGQSSWLQTQSSRVHFPALQNFPHISGSVMRSTV